MISIPRAGQPERRSRSGRMDKNVSASFTLSVLVVAFFAVALYQPDSRLQSSPARAKPSLKAKPVEDRSAAGPVLPIVAPIPSSPDPPKAEPKVALARSRDADVSQVIRRVEPATTAAVAARNVSPPRNEAGRSFHRVIPQPDREPRGAFSSVRAGETLPDVARRVYGSAGDTALLWKANRDLIENKDSPLRPGTMLRTP